MTPRFKLMILVIVTLLGCYIIMDSYLYHQRDSPGCQMSYSRPSFFPIPIPQSKFKEKYNLYLYREGGIDNTNQLTGVPTIFIPGHAGSYKQARSIAAESAYYAQSLSDKGFKSGLDVFTVDLNEEFSGIYGKLILDQAEYLNDALQHILSLYTPLSTYNGRPAPISVMVIGHSMGGVVARIMPSLSNYKKNSINTIFTLATPHSLPPILLDSTMDTLYKTYLVKLPKDIAVISIAGGTLDTIINSDAAILSNNNNHVSTLSIFSTAMPDVWTGCDHMAILWCNQLVQRVASALVDITDIRLPSQTLPLSQRMKMLKKKLLQVAPIVISRENNTMDKSSYQLYMNHHNIIHPKYGQQMKYDFNQNENSDKSFGILTNLQDINALNVYLCNENNNVNDGNNVYYCKRIQSGFQKLPSSISGQKNAFDTLSPFKMLTLDESIWKQYDFMIMELDDKSSNNEEYDKVKNNQTFIKVGWIINKDINDSLFNIAFNGRVTVDMNHQHVLASTFRITSISSPYLSFKLKMKSDSDLPENTFFKTLIQQQFYGESKYHTMDLKDNNDDDYVSLHFHRIPLTTSPTNQEEINLHGLFITIWSPSTYSISLELDWYGSIGKLALRMAPLLPSCLFVIALSYLLYIICLSHHYQHYEGQVSKQFLENINNLSSNLTNWLYCYPNNNSNNNGVMLSISYLFLFILSVGWLQQQILQSKGAENIRLVNQLLLGGGKLSSALPPFLWWITIVPYLVATGVFLTVSIALSFFIHLLVYLRVHQIFLAIYSLSKTYRLSLYIALFSSLPWLPISVIVIIVYIGWFFTCTRYYSIAKTKNQAQYWLQYRYQFGLFMFLTASLPYYVPEVIVFIRDWMIGWQYKASMTIIMKGVPSISGLIILLLVGDKDSIWKSKSSLIIIYAGYSFLLYYILFGARSPFTFQDLWNSTISRLGI